MLILYCMDNSSIQILRWEAHFSSVTCVQHGIQTNIAKAVLSDLSSILKFNVNERFIFVLFWLLISGDFSM